MPTYTLNGVSVNDLVKFPGMAPLVGILVCGSKHDPTVRYVLDGSSQPIAVASYTYETLPDKEREALPPPPPSRLLWNKGLSGTGNPSTTNE